MQIIFFCISFYASRWQNHSRNMKREAVHYNYWIESVNCKKVKLSHDMPIQALGGGTGIALLILDCSSRWGWMVNAKPQMLYPLNKRPSTHCSGGWLGQRAGLDGYGKSLPHQVWNPGLSSLQHVTLSTTLSWPQVLTVV